MSTRLICIVALLALTVIRALAADGIDAKTDSLIRAAMEQAFNEKYDEALRTAEKMIAADPDGLLGYFAAASVRLGIMRLYRTRQFEDEFEELVNTAIKKGQKRSKKGGAWDYFFLGGAYGFRGAHKARELNWIGAFTDGWKGLQALDRALKYDPTLYDAYLGFGLYHYWRSALAGVLRAIPFVGDERQRGIEEMQLAIEKGRYSEVIATYALVEVYYNEKEYEKALELNRRLSEMYPGHIAWLYMEARILDAMQNWPEALQSTRRLIERINNSPYRTDGFLVEGYWLLTKAYIGLDQIEEARKACKTGLELADRRDASKELEAPWETYSEIRKRLKKLCRELSSE